MFKIVGGIAYARLNIRFPIKHSLANELSRPGSTLVRDMARVMPIVGDVGALGP